MKKRAEVLAVSLSAVLLLLYWLPVQHGHCSEHNQLDLQNQPQTSQDVIEQPEETKLDRKKEETAAQDAPDLHTTDHSTATDLDSGDKLQIHESEPQKRNEEELQVDGTAADPALPLDTTTLEHNPDPSASESSSPPEQDTNLLKTDLSPLPAGLTTEQPEPNPATDHDPVLQPSTSTALPAPAHCSAAENSCSSASVTTVPSTAVSSTTGACDAGENTPNDTDLSSYDSLPVVLENTSSSDTAKGTKTALDGASPGINISSKLKEQSVHISPETDPSVPKDQEDIPTFDEWKKIMMEVENEKSQTTHTSCNGGSSSVKKVQKTTNYASVECGAKILSSNPEAKSTSAILMENMDVYMLNPCSNKIWFIIELCQPIQVKQLDIANFELFSSTPKDFLVSISDRYPTNKWAKLGTFHARDERTIQSFPLDEHLYAKYVKMFTKYIKVELLSHFGSEHFCPLSLIRVFGTSMMEEYELNSEPSERLNLQDEDYDYPAGYMPSDDKSSKNIIGSAKDAIMNMVNNIAANVLGGDQEDAARSGGNYSSVISNATETPAVPPSSYMPLETMEVDKQDVSEITETTSVTRDGETGGVSPSSTATILEPPSSTQPEADSISPTPTNEEQIVTLLPKEEDEDLAANKSEKPSSSDQTQRAETDRDERHSSANRCETTPRSCSCVVSLEEYLFRKCFPLSASHKRISGITSHESSSQPGSHTQGSQLSVHVVVPSSVTHSFIAETSSVPESSGTDLVDPVWPNEEKRPGVVGSLDLAPSLTSSLPKLAPTDGPAAKPTRSVDFPALSAVELPQVKLPDQEKTKEEQSEIRTTPIVTSHVQSASAPVLSTGENEVPHEKKPPAVEKSEIETSPTSVAPISTPNTTTDQSLSPQTKTRTTSSTPTLTSTPATESLEATATVGSDPKSSEELLEDVPQGGQSGAGHAGASSQGQTGQPPPPSSSEFYAEMQSTTDVPISGSNQKESVFMRLNNRIKALEVNMSLSGRYLEQLSQRYRKQMEEMQKAFNKTIIKLQNTSRIAEEQDQKQTESIQVLQGQLENVTKLVLNLSVRVSQLQREVSDRHSYLLLSLLLCLLLGLVVFINFCRMSAENPSVEPETSAPSTYSFCCPDRASSGYEDANPKRRASFPFAQSSLQIAATEGPNEAYNVETRRNSTGNNKKKKRCKMKQIQPPETITPTVLSLSAVPNGLPLPCNTLPPGKAHSDLGPTPGNGTVLPHPFRDPASEGSSEGSSHSDEPSFCGIATCGRFCEGLPPPKSRSDKRSYKRRRSKLGSGAELEQLLQPVQCNGPPTGHGDALRGLIGDSGGSGNSQFGVTRAGVTTNKTTTVPGVL